MDDLHGISLDFTALEGFDMIEILYVWWAFVACLLDGTERSREDERLWEIQMVVWQLCWCLGIVLRNLSGVMYTGGRLDLSHSGKLAKHPLFFLILNNILQLSYMFSLLFCLLFFVCMFRSSSWRWKGISPCPLPVPAHITTPIWRFGNSVKPYVVGFNTSWCIDGVVRARRDFRVCRGCDGEPQSVQSSNV